MMRMRTTKTTGMGLELPSPTKGTPTAGGGKVTDGNWEMRPCGMLVQKRTDSDPNPTPIPTIRVRVKYGSVYHEVHISSQATFGELKKMLTGPTGLHHEDQKLMFKNKERDSKTFLDSVGVKNKSKIVLIEDPISIEKRYIEMKKIAKADKVAKSLSDITFEVDRLVGQVSAFESVISRGVKVGEIDLVKLIESLMNQLVKLDGINADGDLILQTNLEVRRVQKYVEKVDMLKIKNSKLLVNNNNNNNGNLSTIVKQSQHHRTTTTTTVFSYEEASLTPPPVVVQSSATLLQPEEQPLKPSMNSGSGAVVITTQWETFDLVPVPAQSPTSTTRTNLAADSGSAQATLNWDLLL